MAEMVVNVSKVHRPKTQVWRHWLSLGLDLLELLKHCRTNHGNSLYPPECFR